MYEWSAFTILLLFDVLVDKCHALDNFRFPLSKYKDESVLNVSFLPCPRVAFCYLYFSNIRALFSHSL